MSDFKGNYKIIIQPNEEDINFGYIISVKASVLATKGWLAYGTNVTAVSVIAYKTADVDNRSLSAGDTIVHDLVVGAPTVTDNVVTVKLTYPTTNLTGYYKLTFILTVDDNSIQEADFNRIVVKDK